MCRRRGLAAPFKTSVAITTRRWTMKRRQSAVMVAAAAAARVALPVLGGALFVACPAAVSAAPSLIITNQGPATDNAGHTTTGWTGFLLTLKADPGKEIGAVDIGQFTSSINGIFATMLQDWTPSKGGATPTPVGSSTTDTNGALDGTDSHVLVIDRNV